MPRSYLPALLALPLLTAIACGGDSTDDLFVGAASGAAGTGASAGGTPAGGQANTGGASVGGSTAAGGQGGEMSGSSGQTGAGAAGQPIAGAGGSPSGGQAGAAGKGGSPVAGQGGAGGAAGKGGTAGKGGAAQGGSSAGGMSQGGAGQGGGSTAGSNTGGSSAGAPGSVCGDGQLVAPEVCDSTDFDGRTCATETGFAESQGALSCVDCKAIDASGCTKAPVCGDGVRNGNEACEGMDLGTQTCATATSNQKTEGTLKCTPQCALDTSGCTTAKPACGNGVVEQGEQCDGTANAQSCASFAPGSTGMLGCKPDCTFDTSTCKPAAQCGDGIINGTEECDDGDSDPNDGCELCQVVCLKSEWEYQKHCYGQSEQSGTWKYAHDQCEMGGGYLVSITSQAESDFLLSVLPQPTSTGESRWIGLEDINTEGTYVWHSQEPFDFTYWNQDEPNDSKVPASEDCVSLYLGNVRWNDISCGTKFRWICEYPPPGQTP